MRDVLTSNRSRSLLVAAVLLTAVSPLNGVRGASALVSAGSVTEVRVAGVAGVPGDASAVVANVTAVDGSSPGYVTAFPCGESPGDASTVNYRDGLAVANSTTVAVGERGRICLFSLTKVNLVVDVQGYFPAGSEYEAMTPRRVADTRGSGATPTAAGTTPTAGPGGFVETFDGNGGFDRFDSGVFHRQDGFEPNKVWQGDHDESCGDPTTTRSLTAAREENQFYTCRDHLMTSVGHVAPYSVAWFSPRQTFRSDDVSRVAWDVNVTDMLGRQWWEVAIVPTDWRSGEPSCPQCSVVNFLTDPAHLPAHPNDAVVLQGGVSKPMVNGENISDRGLCRDWPLDPEGCASKAIRRPFSMTDNRNGTITIDFGGLFTETIRGSFPDRFDVVFKDHNYTPDKEGRPVGYTWHWDNIVIS